MVAANDNYRLSLARWLAINVPRDDLYAGDVGDRPAVNCLADIADVVDFSSKMNSAVLVLESARSRPSTGLSSPRLSP